MKRKLPKPVLMWAAISEDDPPEIWGVGFYRATTYPMYLRKIRVKVTPVVRKRSKP